MRFLPPSPTAPAWDFGSAAPSLNRTEGACGQPLTLRAVPAFISHCPPPPKRLNDEAKAVLGWGSCDVLHPPPSAITVTSIRLRSNAVSVVGFGRSCRLESCRVPSAAYLKRIFA